MMCYTWIRGSFNATPLRVPIIQRDVRLPLLYFSLIIVLSLISRILNDTLWSLSAFSSWNHNRPATLGAIQGVR